MARPRKTKPKPRAKLTAKQELFCRWYVSAEVRMNGAEAARRAGYKGTPAVLAQVASENLRKPHIRQEVDKRLEAASRGANITVETILRDLEDIKAKALKTDQLASATRCAELQGKYLKMFTERIEHVQTIDEVSDEELLELIGQLSRRAGVDLINAITGDGPEDGAGAGLEGISGPH